MKILQQNTSPVLRSTNSGHTEMKAMVIPK